MRARVFLIATVLVVLVSWVAYGRSRDGAAEAVGDFAYGRDELEICFSISPTVTVSGGRATVRELLTTAVEGVLDDPRSRTLGLERFPVKITDGCPDGYVSPPQPSFERPDLVDWPIRGVVDQPMKVSTLVFVVDGDASEQLKTDGYARAPYEAVCDGRVCSESTTALFVSADRIRSPQFLREALIVGLGVDPSGGKYPNGHPDDWKFTPK